MLKNFEDGNCPTFKEITTLISMTIHFVEKLDELLLNEVQQDNYLEKTLYLLFKNNPKNMDVFSFRNTTPEKRVKKIKQLLATVGINNDFYNEQGNEFLEKISKMRAEEFLDSVSLDVYANLICLCPICHRLLHYGREDEKRVLLNQIYTDRASRLVNSGIKLSKNDFIEMVL